MKNLVIILFLVSTTHGADLLVTIPHGNPTTIPIGVGGLLRSEYTTTFDVVNNNSTIVYFNLLVKSQAYNPNDFTKLEYKIKDSSNNVITYGMFNEYNLQSYTSLTTSSRANLTTGHYSVTLFTSGSTLHRINTPLFSPATVTAVPEPSTFLMGIFGAFIIFYLTKRQA